MEHTKQTKGLISWTKYMDNKSIEAETNKRAVIVREEFYKVSDPKGSLALMRQLRVDILDRVNELANDETD